MVGNMPVIQGPEMAMVGEIGDAELAADAKRLEGQNLQIGTSEYQAGMCLKGFIVGRRAEMAIAASSDKLQKQILQNDLVGGYGQCEHSCLNAAATPSPYSDMALKYQPRCAAGMANQKLSWSTDALAKAVATLRTGTSALELYLAAEDSSQLLAATKKTHSDSPKLADYAKEIDALTAAHASAIAKGKAFYNGPKAQRNFADRQNVGAEREVLISELRDIRGWQEDLRRNGSLDAHMRARDLDGRARIKERLIAAKDTDLAQLKEDYESMAVAAGVY